MKENNMKSIAYFEGAAKELRRLIDTDPKQLWAESITKSLDVQHDISPENKILINTGCHEYGN